MAYKLARSWGVQPSEFWQLSTEEFWWEFDTKFKESRRIQKGTGGLSRAEWDEAWKKHKAKMNDAAKRT